MRKWEEPPIFILDDHLGSTNRIVHADGTPVTPGGMRLYKAWGESRYEPDGELTTEYRFTGQPEQQSIGLYFYGARWYDTALSRWVQPDTDVPEAKQGTQAWDRFGYVNNNTVNYVDPSGHDLEQIYFNKHGRLPVSQSIIYERRIRSEERTFSRCEPGGSKYYCYPENADYYTFSYYSNIVGYLIAIGIIIPGLAEPTLTEEALALLTASLISGGFSMTIDRYGQVYVAPGISAGKSLIPTAIGSPLGSSIYLSPGYLNTPGGRPAQPQEISSLLTGISFNHSITSALIAGGITHSPNSDFVGGEFGFGIPPQVNAITLSYGIPLFSFGNR